MVLLSTGYDQNAVESQLILLDICIAQQRHLSLLPNTNVEKKKSIANQNSLPDVPAHDRPKCTITKRQQSRN